MSWDVKFSNWTEIDFPKTEIFGEVTSAWVGMFREDSSLMDELEEFSDASSVVILEDEDSSWISAVVISTPESLG